MLTGSAVTVPAGSGAPVTVTTHDDGSVRFWAVDGDVRCRDVLSDVGRVLGIWPRPLRGRLSPWPPSRTGCTCSTVATNPGCCPSRRLAGWDATEPVPAVLHDGGHLVVADGAHVLVATVGAGRPEPLRRLATLDGEVSPTCRRQVPGPRLSSGR